MEIFHGRQGILSTAPKLQSHSLDCSSSKLSASDWSKQLISRVLHISYGQYIYRNTSLQDATHRYLQLQQQKDVLLEIDCLAQMYPEDLTNSSKYLLGIDFSSLTNDSAERQVTRSTPSRQLAIQDVEFRPTLCLVVTLHHLLQTSDNQPVLRPA